ncbi:MAG: flagellar motor protein MotB, partial [Planctomycetota bacterium]
MAREKKQVVEDEAPGAPEWMVTFSDCMTLLLTFFVLLLSFSSFDDKT